MIKLLGIKYAGNIHIKGSLRRKSGNPSNGVFFRGRRGSCKNGVPEASEIRKNMPRLISIMGGFGSESVNILVYLILDEGNRWK